MVTLYYDLKWVTSGKNTMNQHTSYELFEELGRGEHSIVYRAYDLNLGREVAIKELAADSSTPAARQDALRAAQFLQEAAFLAQFEHEHVLRIYSIEKQQNWIVMELMQGTLASQIAQQPFDADTARSVLRQMLLALDFLHLKQKVHGAVRPTNILINEQGTVKLSDFEQSHLDGELRVPSGSKKYLAPELIRSEFGEFGPAVDLYCLGFTALELLTGPKFDSLFPGTGAGAIDADVAWLRWHSSSEQLKPVQEIVPSCPSDLAGVIDDLLNKRVDERPESAQDVLSRLADKPLVAVPVPSLPTDDAVPAIDSMIPGQDVRLREWSPLPPAKLAHRAQKAPGRARPAQGKKKIASTGNRQPKDKINQFLSRPYVLWPLCAALLLIALMAGRSLNRTKSTTGEIANVVPPNPAEMPNPAEITTTEIEVSEESSQLKARIDVHTDPSPEEVQAPIEQQGNQPENGTEDGKEEKLDQEQHLKVDRGKPEDNQLNLDRMLAGERAELGVDVGVEGDESGGELARHEGHEARQEQPQPAYELPAALITRQDAPIDIETGLPSRAYARVLQESAPLEFVLIPAGEYRVGVAADQARAWELAEQPFRLEHPIYMAIHETTNSQYSIFALSNDSEQAGTAWREFVTGGADDSLPARNLTIQDAARFCDWVGGRLPTEHEWEAAVRGIDDAGYPLPWPESSALTPDHCQLFYGGADDDHPVSVYQLASGASGSGLFHAIGNVSEWCNQQVDQERFVVKGCSFQIPPGDHVRVTWRYLADWKGAADIGLRVMVPVVPSAQANVALAFVPTTTVDDLTDETTADREKTQLVTANIEGLANEFQDQAELVIDSGGFIDEVSDVAFSPDGKLLAAAGGKCVRLWDTQSGDLMATLRGDRSRTSYGNTNAVAFSPDGKFLLVGINDYRAHGSIRVYATEQLDEIQQLLPGHTAPCRKLCFSRDGKYLASVDTDGTILVWDWSARKIINTVPARDPNQSIFDVMTFPLDEPYLLGVDFEGPQVYSAIDGRHLTAADAMPTPIRGWLVDIFNQLVKYPYGSSTQPRVLDFRLEQSLWAAGGVAKVEGRSRFWVGLWESREPVTSLTPATQLGQYDGHRWSITCLSIGPENDLVASGDKFGEVHLWNYRTGERIHRFAGQGKPIYEVAFEKGSSRIAFGTRPHSPGDWKRNNYGDATQVIDLQRRAIMDATALENLQLANEQPSRGDTKVSVSRAKQEPNYFVKLQDSGRATQYRISSGRNPTVFTLLDEAKLGVTQPVVFGDDEGLLALWDTAGDELKRAFIGHQSFVSGISTSSNGKLLVSASTDRTIRLWSLDDYRPTGIFDFKFENTTVIKVIPGTSSAEAGVQVGDRILNIDGKSLTEMFNLMLLGKFDYRPGQLVPVSMQRGETVYDYEMKMVEGYDFADPLLTCFVGNDGQWIIWNPQGYYDASPGADQLIGWHVNRGPDKTRGSTKSSSSASNSIDRTSLTRFSPPAPWKKREK